MVQAIATIRRVSDGAERTVAVDFVPEDDDYYWSEGNYSCDCNRHLLFTRADGLPEWGFPCGETAYRVIINSKDDGRELYRDERQNDI